jgi:signal transduction histidine kinase
MAQSRDSEGGLEIVVRDEGTGMSEETQRQLFHPFFSRNARIFRSSAR